MRKLHANLLVLLFALFPTQLTIHFWFADSLVLGRRVDYLASVISSTDIVLILFVLLTLVLYRPKITPFILPIVFVPVMLLFVWYGFTPPSFALFQLITYFKLMALGYALVKSRPTRQQLLIGLGIGISCSVLLALLQFFNQGSLGGFWYWLGERRFSVQTPGIAQTVAYGKTFLRPYATFPHPNVLGGFLVGIAPLFLLARGQTPLHYMLRRICLALIGLGIFLSFSRIVWIVCAAQWIWYLGLSHQKRLWRLGLLGLGSFAFEELLFGRFEMLLGNQTTIAERKTLLDGAWQLWHTHPWFGVGVRNFIPKIISVTTPPYLLQPVHSVYALLLSELGVIGFSGIVMGTVYAMRVGFWHKRYWQLLAMGSLLVLGLFDHYVVTLPQTQLLFVTLLALLIM